MAWWNPLTWFTSYDPKTATAAQVLKQVDVIEDGKAESVQAIDDAIAAGDKYLFEIQTLLATGEVVYVVPMGEDRSPLCASDRKPPFAVIKALLTLDEAARLKTLSKAGGGDGLAKTPEDIQVETPAPAPEPVIASSLFRAEMLEKARPDQVVKAAVKGDLEP